MNQLIHQEARRNSYGGMTDQSIDRYKMLIIEALKPHIRDTDFLFQGDNPSLLVALGELFIYFSAGSQPEKLTSEGKTYIQALIRELRSVLRERTP